MSDGSHQLLVTLGLNVIDLRDADWSPILSPALVSSSFVRVVFFEADAAIVLHIVEAVILPTATTAVRIGITVDALLLGEFKKLASLGKVLPFHGSNS